MSTPHAPSSATQHGAHQAGCRKASTAETCPASWFAQTGIALVVLLFSFCGALVVSGWTRGAADISGTVEAEASSPVSYAALRMDGEAVYQRVCQSCHQMQGQGIPGVFPPLVESEWVVGDKGRLVRLLLHGLAGAVDVGGSTYSGAMPPWGGSLDDEQVAQVATYIRTSWGNDAPEVTTDEVARVRAATKERTKQWTAEELEAEANQGIPEAGGE